MSIMVEDTVKLELREGIFDSPLGKRGMFWLSNAGCRDCGRVGVGRCTLRGSASRRTRNMFGLALMSAVVSKPYAFLAFVVCVCVCMFLYLRPLLSEIGPLQKSRCGAIGAFMQIGGGM